MQFDDADMARNLSGLAALRRPGFSWQADTYLALGRSLSPHQESLALHADCLHVLLSTARTGFLSQGCLEKTLCRLHCDREIFGPGVPHHQLDRLCKKSADNWRILCKHVYELRKAEKLVDHDRLAACVSLIQLPPPGHRPAPTTRSASFSSASGESSTPPEPGALSVQNKKQNTHKTITPTITTTTTKIKNPLPQDGH